MVGRRATAAGLLATAVFLPASLSAEGRDPVLRLVRTIPLEGVEGRIDHFALDATGKTLAIAALGAGRVLLVDLEKGTVQAISDLKEPQGVAILPKTGRVVVACGGDGSLRYYDPKTREQVDVVRLGDDADNVRLEPDTDRIWVGHGEGGLAVVDKGNRLFDVALEAHPEAFAIESRGRRVFVNVPGARQVAVVDREKREVVATWPLGSIRGNFPMALDEEKHRLFVGCRAPARLLVYDTETGKLAADLDASGDVDDVFLDAATDRAYLVCGEGFVDVVHRRGEALERVGRVPTRPGTRTGLFVPATRTLYVASPRSGDHDAELRVLEAPK